MRRSEIPQLALDIRHAGELLLHGCKCNTGTHRWRHPTCSANCSNGRVIDGSTVTLCTECWVHCTNEHYLDEAGNYRPCPLCKPHTLGEHLHRAADNMTAGPRAKNTDPDTGGWRYDHDDTGTWPVPNDTTGETALHLVAVNEATELNQILNDAQTVQRRLHNYINRMRPDRHAPTPDPSTDNEYCRHHLATLGTCEPRFRGDLCRSCYSFELAHPGIHPPKALLEVHAEGRRWTQTMIDDALAPLKAKKKKGKRKAS